MSNEEGSCHGTGCWGYMKPPKDIDLEIEKIILREERTMRRMDFWNNLEDKFNSLFPKPLQVRKNHT